MSEAIRLAAAATQIRQMPSFAAKSEFWRELKADASKHLAAETKRGRPSVGDPRLQGKAAIILTWFGLSYGALLCAPTLYLGLAATISLALAASSVGFGVFHDANHGTLFGRPAANLAAARLCSVLLGPARLLWVYKHQRLHHRQPNVAGWDDDLETRGFLRLSPACAWHPRFRGQHVKAFLYYGLNTLEWLFWKDFYCLVKGQLNDLHALSLSKEDRAELLLCKGIYALLFVIPPFVILPLGWAIATFCLFHVLFSCILAVVFQVAHLTPGMEFAGVRAGDDWATHQVRTTADFATGSRFTTWFTGGLNHQVEHHLFPNVAHTHYPRLREIVRTVAKRHELPYHDLGGVSFAIRQHFALLRTLSFQDSIEPSSNSLVLATSTRPEGGGARHAP